MKKTAPSRQMPAAGNSEIEHLRDLLESRSEWTRMIIHDLKGPLGVVIANLDLLSDSLSRKEDRDRLDLAREECQDLLKMIQTILEIGKMEKGRMELNLSIIDLRELLHGVHRGFKAVFLKKGVKVRLNFDSSRDSLAADRALLERILDNLVLNALQYTAGGGEVTIGVGDNAKGDRVVLTVKDNGAGIPEEDRQRIFELYAQAPPVSDGGASPPGSRVMRKQAAAERFPRNGTGIGLTFCKLAVELHGGQILVESEVGKGSTFRVELPADLVPSGSGLF